MSSIEFDPRSDVTIHLGTQKALVNSTCLRLASKVFATMLSPKYAEGALLEKTGATEITLEDDPVAVLILMNVLHLRNREVPRSLEIGHLHSLAMIVDKYDMFPAVMPWANMWIDSFREEIKPISTAKCQQLLGYEKLLAVSWVLEHEDVFCRVARMLVFTASPDENGMLRVNEGEHFEDGLPDAVIDAIATNRTRILDKLIESVSLILREYSDYKRRKIVSCKARPCSHERHRLCDAVSMSTITHAMVRSGIFERQSDNLSAIHVLDELKDVEANSAVLPGIRGEDHTKCGPRTRILELVELVRSDLLEELEMKGLRMKLENRG